MAKPHLIELEEAVSRIKQACEGRSEGQPSPFFFMTGAGISAPSVPLAQDIVSQCRTTAGTYGRSVEPSSKEAIAVYSHWIEKAYGEASQRQKYLRSLIEGKPISHANFRLAHLLLKDEISNIVVTTNFDDFLSRALTLFGKQHIVCDHPQTVGRINYREPDLQIVHLHGTHWFYDCCNLRGELQDRAQASHQTTATMASLLDMILWDRSPLVIGYGGWEGDVFMDAFRRRLGRELGNNAYWFCYRRDSVDSMPEWLRNHPNIRFVVPADQVSRPEARGDQNGDHLVINSAAGAPVADLFVGEDAIPSLPSDRVFASLIQAFKLKAPLLTSDPLGFLVQQLNSTLPQDDASDKDGDIYAIKYVIERVKSAKLSESEERSRATPESRESDFESIRDAVRRADYRSAIAMASLVHFDKLSPENLHEFLEIVWSAASKPYDNLEDEIFAYGLVVRVTDRLCALSSEPVPKYEERVAYSLFKKGSRLGALNRNEEALAVYEDVLQRFGDAPELALREQVAKSLFNMGATLGIVNRSEEALAFYEQVFQRFGEAPELALRDQVARSLFNKGATLGVLHRSEEAIQIYNEVVQRFGEAPELALREQVANSLFNKGATLGVLHRSEEAIQIYDEVVQRFGEVPELAFREIVAKSLFNKGVRSRILNRIEEMIQVYDEVVQRFGEAPELALREIVAKSLVNKGFKLGGLNRHEEEFAVYDQVVQRFGDAPELVLREQVAKSLVNKGITLGQLHRSEEAIKVYDDVVQRFGDAAELPLREQVKISLNGIGFRLLIDAKALRLAGDEDGANVRLKRAQERLNAAAERDPNDAMIVGNLAYLAFLCSRKNESREILLRAIALGGQKVKDDELADAEINRLPEDDEFCEMVRSIPLPTPAST